MNTLPSQQNALIRIDEDGREYDKDSSPATGNLI